MALRNGCQLITYPNGLGANLRELESVLQHFEGALSGLHILPFYPSSADRGFSPLRYDTVDPRFGGWDDIDRIASKYDVIADFMVNHISRRSSYFQDYLEHGEDSPFADLFLRLDRLNSGRGITRDQLASVFRRKPSPPFLAVRLPDGSHPRLWCTFADEQIDLNVDSPVGRRMLRQWLCELTAHPIKMLRLDAFAYAVKRPGTSCFMVEPGTSALLEWITSILAPRSVEILPEIHSHHSIELRLSSQGYWVYDFNLPLLVLQSLYEANNKNLLYWLHICPRKQITTLDTHDGLPVLDVADLMSEAEIERTRRTLFTSGANAEPRYSMDPSYKNANLYQLNSTYYSALGDDDESYLTARAIQFFTPGIPQVYYVGLLAGRNDIELVERTRLGRDINRHSYSRAEAIRELDRPVVQRLRELMRFRNSHPAFNGEFTVRPSGEHELILEWARGPAKAVLEVDLKRRTFRISSTRPEAAHPEQPLLAHL